MYIDRDCALPTTVTLVEADIVSTPPFDTCPDTDVTYYSYAVSPIVCGASAGSPGFAVTGTTSIAAVYEPLTEDWVITLAP